MLCRRAKSRRRMPPSSIDLQVSESGSDVPAAVGGAAPLAPPLPRPLNYHNSIEPPNPGDAQATVSVVDFPPSARRTAFALQCNTTALCERHGIEHVGFLTLTFADHVLDPAEAQRRFNSLASNVLRPRYGVGLRVFERQKSGRIHYHLLVVVAGDIRTGCDFKAFERRDYRSAPPPLRREWAYWRATAKLYGFGRTELLPIRSTSQAVGRYVGKYVSKHIEQRHQEDHNVRLVSYFGSRVATTRFAWAGAGGREWRLRLGSLIHSLFEARQICAPTEHAMKLRYGKHWCYRWKEVISHFPIVEDSSHG